MIKLQIIGNLGKDCQVNDVNGKKVINFSVAHTEKFKDGKGEQREKTTWVECAYWSDSKVGEYLKKGQQVYVEGSPEIRTYETQDGRSGASLNLRVFNIQLLGSAQPKPENGNANKSQTAQQPSQSTYQSQSTQSVQEDDNLPF